MNTANQSNRVCKRIVSQSIHDNMITCFVWRWVYRYFILRFSWTTCMCDIYIHVIFTYNADWSAVLFNKRTGRREGIFSSLFCNTIYRQILHILMKNSENRIWVMYNIKVHYVQVSEPCSVYLPRKIEICRSYMRSNRMVWYIWPPNEVNKDLFLESKNLANIFKISKPERLGYVWKIVVVKPK